MLLTPVSDAALIEFSQVSAMPEPSNINVRAVFDWLTDRDEGGLRVNGKGSHAWGNQFQNPERKSAGALFRKLLRSIFAFWEPPPSRTNPRLVVPRPHPGVDGLTSWVADVWSPFCFAFKESRGRAQPNQDGELGPQATPTARRWWQLWAEEESQKEKLVSC